MDHDINLPVVNLKVVLLAVRLYIKKTSFEKRENNVKRKLGLFDDPLYFLIIIQ